MSGKAPGEPRHPLGLTRLEIASGMVTGEAVEASPWPDDDEASPLEALEQAMVGPLARPPCLVSFSGGRDSSVVLSVAVRVARREGLDLPVPVTQRFPDAPETDESVWQELVVHHLGLHDWHRMEVTDELDLVGPVSRAVLLRHGLLWPPNVYVHAPMLEVARGGSLLTGIDGDGLWGGWRWQRLGEVGAGRSSLRPRDVGRLAQAAAPQALRRAVDVRRTDLSLSWLRDRARRAVTEAWASERSSEPVRWDRRLRWWAGRRYLSVVCRSLALLAADAGAEIAHPLLDRRFLAALARAGGRFGLGGRTATTRLLFAGVLPLEVLVRPGKAVFSQAFWRAGTRAFIEDWDGSGVDLDLIDEQALRLAWAAGPRDFRVATSVLSALLESTGRPATG